MLGLWKLSTFHFICLYMLTFVQCSIHERSSLLNTCMDGKHHKFKPGPEEFLHKCNAWEENSCCTNNTAFYANDDHSPLYSFNMSHCGAMSDECKSWFHDNNCFYECSPNLGPWLVSVKSSFRNEKFVKVPLCKSQCDAWWSACVNEATCIPTWNSGFNWTKNPRAMSCPNDKPCRPFTEIYHNATFFCENIYGPHDFQVVSDEEHCMKLRWNNTNPNKQVAEHFAIKEGDKNPDKEDGKKPDADHPSSSTTSAPITSPKNNSNDDDTLPAYQHPTNTPNLQVHGTIASIVIAILIIIAACGVLAYWGIKRYRGSSFTHQGVPVQFPGSIFRPKAFTPVSSTGDDRMAEMSFMQYDDEEEPEPEDDNSTPKLNGSLQMKL